jgi:methylglutamate dehydrogenase subunit B
MDLHCPFCGRREIEEFRFRTLIPAPTASSAYSLVYERTNDPVRSMEYWQHVHGCRAWLVVERNPTTGEVQCIRSLADDD